MKTKCFIMLLMLLFSHQLICVTCAQTCLVYGYDADGNRVSRVIEPNCVGIRDYDEVNENDDVLFGVFPNPNNGSFKIVMPEPDIDSESHCEIYDINGMLILEEKLCDIVTDIDIGDHPAGIYLVKIVNAVNVCTRIILKQ